MKFYKQLRKRGLAMFMALVMCLSLLPVTAMADELGEAGETIVMEPTNPKAVTSKDKNVTINKSATRSETPGVWNTTMTVEAKQQIQTKPLELVLVLDASVSMDWCTHIHDKTCNVHTELQREGSSKQYEIRVTSASCGHNHLDGVMACNVGENNNDPDEQNAWCAHKHTDACIGGSDGKVTGFESSKNTSMVGRLRYTCGHHHADVTSPEASGCTSRWDTAKAAMAKLVGDLAGLDREIDIAVVEFNTGARPIYPTVENSTVQQLTKTNVSDITNAISAYYKLGSGTHPGEAMTFAKDKFTNSTDTNKVMVLLSDGKPNESGEPWRDISTNLKNAGIEIFTIGFTVDADALKTMASDTDHYMTAANASDLAKVFDKISTKLAAMIEDSVGEHVTIDKTSTSITAGVFPQDSSLSWTPADGKIVVDPTSGKTTETIKYPVKLDLSKMKPGPNANVPLNGDAYLNYSTDANGTLTEQPSLKFGIPTDTVYIAQLTTSYAVTDAEGKTVTVTDEAYQGSIQKGIVKWTSENDTTTFTATQYVVGQEYEIDGQKYYYTGSSELPNDLSWNEGKNGLTTSEAKEYTLVHNFSTEKPVDPTDWTKLAVSKTLTTVNGAAVVESDEPVTVYNGDKLEYTITITNNTGKDLTNVTFSETLVSNLSNENGKFSVSGATQNNEGQYVVSELKNGTAATVTVTTEVKLTAGQDGKIPANAVNKVEITSATDPEGKGPDPDTSLPSDETENPVAHKITGFTKERVTDLSSVSISEDLAKMINTDAKVVIGTESVTLLYKLTVTGTPGAKYTVTDPDAVFINNDDAAASESIWRHCSPLPEALPQWKKH